MLNPARSMSTNCPRVDRGIVSQQLPRLIIAVRILYSLLALRPHPAVSLAPQPNIESRLFIQVIVQSMASSRSRLRPRVPRRFLNKMDSSASHLARYSTSDARRDIEQALFIQRRCECAYFKSGSPVRYLHWIAKVIQQCKPAAGSFLGTLVFLLRCDYCCSCKEKSLPEGFCVFLLGELDCRALIPP